MQGLCNLTEGVVERPRLLTASWPASLCAQHLNLQKPPPSRRRAGCHVAFLRPSLSRTPRPLLHRLGRMQRCSPGTSAGASSSSSGESDSPKNEQPPPPPGDSPESASRTGEGAAQGLSGDGGAEGKEGGPRPLEESRSELLADVEGLRALSEELRGAAAGDAARAAQWYEGVGFSVRGAVEEALGLLQGLGSKAWGPGQWALVLGAAVLALALGQRVRGTLWHRGSAASVSAALGSGSERQQLLGDLDVTDRAQIFRLQHQLAVQRTQEAIRLRDLLKEDDLLGDILGKPANGGEGPEGAAAEVGPTQPAEGKGQQGVSGGAPALSPPPEFWVQRQWWKHRPRMPYTWLLDKVSRYEVKSAVYSQDMRRLYVSLKEGFPTDFAVDIPVDPFLAHDLRTRGVALGMVPRSHWAFVGGVAAVAPSIGLLCLIGALQGKMQELMNERLYDLVKMDRFQLILPEDAREQLHHSGREGKSRDGHGGEGGKEGERNAYDDVVMAEEIWQSLEEMMTYMRDPMKYYNRGVLLPRGILLSGPPGTGKTLLARSMARQCGLPFVFASGAEFVDSSAERGVDKVFNIFFTARANAPCFLFVDEIDALAGKTVVRDEDRQEIFEEFLKELDGDVEHTDVDRFSRRQAVVLIAATNRPHELHEELLAPGRIDREIHISLPTEEQRVAIFGVHSRDRVLAPSVDFSKLAFRTVGFSGADIRNLVNEASIIAVRKGHSAIEQEDIVSALDKELFESLGVSMTSEEQLTLCDKVPEDVRQLLAVHEAGHVLLAHLFPSFDWHAFTDILPAGQERALTVFYPRQSMLQRGHTTEGYVRMQMVVAHGGRCAERIVFGDDALTDAGQDDLIKISRLARELACSAASPRLGILPLTMHPIMEPPPLPGEAKLIPDSWSRPGTQVADMSVELSEMFTREVTRYVEEAEDMAMRALRDNRHILDKLTQHLLQHYRISGLDAAAMVESMEPLRLPDLLREYSSDMSPSEDTVRLDPESPGRYSHLELYPAPLHRC